MLSRSEAEPIESMATPITDRAAYRIRNRNDPADKPKGYARTYEVLDERSQRTQARCDLIGSAALKRQKIVADDGRRWTLEPNRKVMPSQWALRDANGNCDWQFAHKAWGKLVNPAHKALLAVLDGEGRESMRLADLDAGKLPVLLGLEWGKYALVRGGEPVAALTQLPRENARKDGRLMGAVRRFLQSSDEALVSVGADHPLPAHAVLALYLLYGCFTDPSVG